MDNVRALSQQDRAVMSGILEQAFANDPVMRWIVPDPEDYERVARPFFELIVKQTLEAGASFTNHANEGVSLWRGPHHKLSFFSQLVSFVRMFLLMRGNLDRGIRLQQRMESYYPRRPFWHLTYLATLPERQGQGVGSQLLKPIDQRADAQQLPIYLECSNRTNLGFYRNRGFRLVDEIKLRDGPTVWPMIKGA